MIFRILRKILQRHSKLHLVIPMVAALGLDYLTATYTLHRFLSWEEFWLRALAAGLTVLVTYLVIMYFLIKKETSIRVSGIDLEILRRSLRNATGLFATSTIPFIEWFDPVSQVYFSIIVGQQIVNRSFRHSRVFLFFGQGEIRNLDSMYLDGYYSKCLAEIHQNYEMKPAFLRPGEIAGLLAQVSPEDAAVFGRRRTWFPYWLRLPPRRGSKSVVLAPHWWYSRNAFDFALIELPTRKCVLRVSKPGQEVRIERIDDTNKVAAYERLVMAINGIVYDAGTSPPELRPENDFSNLSPLV
jgi:hypothetical protein